MPLKVPFVKHVISLLKMNKNLCNYFKTALHMYSSNVNVTLKIIPTVQLHTLHSHLLSSALDMFWFGGGGGVGFVKLF